MFERKTTLTEIPFLWVCGCGRGGGGGRGRWRGDYRFEKIKLFHCMNFKQHLVYNSRGAWHTQYAMLPWNHKCDDDINLLPEQLQSSPTAVLSTSR